jgi:hypothetical protein
MVTGLLSVDRHHHFALSVFDITFQVKNLLPRSQNQFALFNGYGQRGSKPGCLEMGVSVAIMPGLLMPVISDGVVQETVLEPTYLGD